MWQQIKDSKGNIKIGTNNIIEEQVKCYSNLLSSEGWDKDAANTLLNNVETFVTEEQKEMCEKEISESELNKAINILKTGKAPGFDGIPGEFYKKYWDIIKDHFTQVIKEIYKLKN